jgi:prepilin-type N-terminal cleavage/methylation domain-containing protein
MRIRMVPVHSRHGFSLLELLIALAIGMVLLAVVTTTFINQRQVYAVQDEVEGMMQNAMVGLDVMQRDIMFAGYNPTETSGAGIVAATANSLQFTMDLNGDDDLGDPEENVTYALYDADADGDWDLGRDTGTGYQLIAENIVSLSLTYRLADGSETSAPTAAQLSQIRLIDVSLTARTAKPDRQYPANGGYRTQTLTMVIHLRNMDA